MHSAWRSALVRTERNAWPMARSLGGRNSPREHERARRTSPAASVDGWWAEDVADAGELLAADVADAGDEEWAVGVDRGTAADMPASEWQAVGADVGEVPGAAVSAGNASRIPLPRRGTIWSPTRKSIYRNKKTDCIFLNVGMRRVKSFYSRKTSSWTVWIIRNGKPNISCTNAWPANWSTNQIELILDQSAWSYLYVAGWLLHGPSMDLDKCRFKREH